MFNEFKNYTILEEIYSVKNDDIQKLYDLLIAGDYKNFINEVIKSIRPYWSTITSTLSYSKTIDNQTRKIISKEIVISLLAQILYEITYINEKIL